MGKKKTKTTERVVILGNKALSFYDASTGIFIGRGDKKKLTQRQLSSPKIKKALHNGHLQYSVDDSKPVEIYDDDAVEKLKENFETMVSNGMEASKIAQAFSDEEVDKIAAEYELTRDSGESSVDVIESIIAVIEGENKD